MTAAQTFAGVYDAYGRELTLAHVAAQHTALLGPHLTTLAAQHHVLAQRAATHADDAAHPVHAQLAQVTSDLNDASHGRLSGQWAIDRYDAEIEWYAAHLLLHRPLGQPITPAEIAAIDFHALPTSVRLAADTAMKRDQRPIRTEFAETFENLFLTVGISALWQQAIGNPIVANAATAPAVTYAYYNNAQARICVGDSTTVASAGQTWLQASSNKYCVGMDANYPVQSTNQLTLRGTFASGNATYAWQEFVIDSCNGSNATPTTQSGGSALDRVVSSQGTKGSGQTWQPTMALSIS